MANSTSSASAVLIRIIGVAVLSLSFIAAGLQIIGILNQLDHPEPNASTPAMFAAPLLVIIAGMSVYALLEALARLIAAREHTTAASAADPTPAINRLLASVNELRASLPMLVSQLAAPPPPELPEPVETSGFSLATDTNVEAHLAHMVKLLEEMKEVSMLDETQRQSRRKANQARRKSSRLEEVIRCINSHDWQQADATLHLLESLHPDDAEVAACRTQLDNARIATQADAWDQLQHHVNDLLALSKYPEAIVAALKFLEQYPNHTEGQQLTTRIRQEQASYTENTSSRLYDEIKAAVENRKWRIALDGIQTFLDRFPDHPRAGKIRQQIRIIQKNAEIEERHEQEERIRSLINGRQFAEAADLAEDLLQRFPDSPQAAYLTELLPKLRERSAVGTEDIIAS